MVVMGLSEYILNSSHLRRVNVSVLADHLQQETGKRPKLLLRISTAKAWIWNTAGAVLRNIGDYPTYTAVSGPDFHLVADRARCFVRALKSVGVDPVFFIDISSEDSSDGEVLQKQKNRIAREMSDGYLIQQMLERTTVAALENVKPNELAERQILHSLREEGGELVFCTHQKSLQAIAQYVRSHEETCGVVSSEADFAVISGCVLFPRSGFDCENLVGLRRGVSIDENPSEVVALAISSAGLAESLGIREDQLPDLAVLCGTEHTRLFLGRLSVLTALGIEGSDVDDIADWLEDTEGPLLENDVIKGLCTLHPEFREALEESYRAFAVGEPPLVDPPSFASPVCELVEREMVGHCSMAAAAARMGNVMLPVLLESLTLGQPSILELLRPLRSTIYSLLGVSAVSEYGRTATKACEKQVVPVCSSEEESVAAVQRLRSLRGLESCEKLGIVYSLSTIPSVLSVSSVLLVVDSALKTSLKFPEMECPKLHKLALVCCSLRLLALLNKSASLAISDEEMDALLVACLTCATEGKVLPHIVHVLPSMKAVTIAEWFCIAIDSVYQLAAIVGSTEAFPEPRNVFYPMAYLPYHIALEPHTNLNTRQTADIKSVQTAMDFALSLSSVYQFKLSVFDADVPQTLPDLITQCNAALEEVLENMEELLPRTMTAPLSELFRPRKRKSESESSSDEEEDKSERVWDREELPIMEHRERILELIGSHQVVCIEGETGCGKSSQVPQFILQRFPVSKVLVSQPNSLAAKKLAERVQEEMRLPSTVVTHCDDLHTEEGSARLIYGTNRFLLQALLNIQKGEEEWSYTHIVLDEVHERTTDIDFGMFLARQLAARAPDLKIVLMSATLQGKLFVEYFRQALGSDRICDPYFVGIRRFPVHVVFIDELSELLSRKRDVVQAGAMAELARLQTKLEGNSTILAHMAEVSPHAQEVCINLILAVPEPGDTVLVFLPGLADIIDLQSSLSRKLRQLKVKDRFRIFVLHLQVPIEDEKEVFDRPQSGQANVIISTTIAESSITIPHLKLVIDFAIRRYMIYDPKTHISKLTRQWCSKSSCTQRAGRVGRVSPGTAVHLITREDHKKLAEFNLSEIVFSPLAKTVLKAKKLVARGCGVSLPSELLGTLIEPPSLLQFQSALHDLAVTGAILHDPQQHSSISEDAEMTLFGEFCVGVPLDLHLCRLIFLGILFGCPNDAVVLAAGLSMYQDIFTMPTRMIMDNMKQFCESLSRSTFSRLSLDAGCYSKPIMIRNMYIEWLRFADSHWVDNRREMATQFSFKFSVRVTRLLHFETSVADIARAVAKWLPPGTRSRLELETLSRVDRQRVAAPVQCSNTYFATNESMESSVPSISLRPNARNYVPPHLRNMARHRHQRALRQLHFCDNYHLLKMLITAASPSEILLGERHCDSSHPDVRTFARRCVSMVEEEGFKPSHTLSMDLSGTASLDLWAEQLRETNEATIQELYSSLPPKFRFPVRVRLDKDANAAVVDFSSEVVEASHTIARIAQNSGYTPGSTPVNESTVQLSVLSPELHVLWRLGEYRDMWEVDDVNAVFPILSHPNTLLWHVMDKSRRPVNTALLNFRNPTALMCLFKEPAYPYLAVASCSFTNDSQVTMTPDMTVLPPPPHSLVMVLSFQAPTSVTELLIDRREGKVRGMRLNHNDIPCKDIDQYLSVETLRAINRFRLSLSNALSSSPKDRHIQQTVLQSSELHQSLAALLTLSPPHTSSSDETTPLLTQLAETEVQSGEPTNRANLVWERITPGQLAGSAAEAEEGGVYYPALRCSLVGSQPYSESPSQTTPTLSPPVQYRDSLSTKLLLDRFDRVEDSSDDDGEVDDDSKFSTTGWRKNRAVKEAAESIDCETTESTTPAEKDSKADGAHAEPKSSAEEVPAHNISFPSLVVAKLEQEIVRHLQRNNKMEFLSELRVQRRIKHMCSLIRTTLNIPFFLQRPKMFQVREVEEGADAATEGREYLIVLDRSKWREVDIDEEEPVLPPSMRIISRAKRETANRPPPPLPTVTEGTQTEAVSRPSSASERGPEKEAKSSPSKPLTATRALKLSDSKATSTPLTACVVEDKKTEPAAKKAEPAKKTASVKKADSSKASGTARGGSSSESSDQTKTETAKKTVTVVTKKRTPVVGSDEHLALFILEYIKKRGGELRLAVLRKETLRDYYDRYPNLRWSGYRYLRKAFLLQYSEYFHVYEDGDKILHVRIVEEKKLGVGSKSSSSNSPPALEKKSTKRPSAKESTGPAKKAAESQLSAQKPSIRASSLGTEREKAPVSFAGKQAKTEEGNGGRDKAGKVAGKEGGKPETQVFFVHVPTSSRRSQEPVTVAEVEAEVVSSSIEPSPSHGLSQFRSKTPTRDHSPLSDTSQSQPSLGQATAAVGPDTVLPAVVPAAMAAVTFTTGTAPPTIQHPAIVTLAHPHPQYQVRVMGGVATLGPPTQSPIGGPAVLTTPTLQLPGCSPPPLPVQLEDEEVEDEWHSSEESWLSEEEFGSRQQHEQQRSPSHLTQYLYNYLSTHSFPFGCPIAELDVQFKSNYRKQFGSKLKMTRITADFVKAHPDLFKVQDELLLKLRDGVDQKEANSFKGRPYTPEHVNDYYSRYLGKEGVIVTMTEAQDVFERVYKKEHKIPANPLIWFLSDTFFKRSSHQFALYSDVVVFPVRGKH